MNKKSTHSNRSKPLHKLMLEDKTLLKGKTVNPEAKIVISQGQEIVDARQRGRLLAERLGFSPSRATLLATAISELARNIVLYAEVGEVVLGHINKGDNDGVMILVSDNGPGIANVDHALMSGYSTSNSLGIGLPGVREIVDDFHIESKPGKGTTIVCIMWR